MEAISMACGAMAMLFHEQSFEAGEKEIDVARTLLHVSMMKGYALASFNDSPDMGSAMREYERRRMLSQAGARGAQSRHQPFAAVKNWALDQASIMRGADVDIARKLAKSLPADLADASKDPERLIYEALRSKRKVS